ncbi:MAG: hypothetical protein AAGG75_18940, partial [Bacteroidota bacterium]
QYLKSNHSNRLTTTQKLFNYIKEFHPYYSSDKLDKAYAFKRIFKGESYNNKKLMDTLSDLHISIKEFLLVQEIKKESIERDFLFLQILKDRNLEKLYLKQIGQSKTKLNENIKQDLWNYLDLMKLHHLNYFLPNNKLSPEQDSIKKAMKNMDLFYTATKLLYSSELYSRKNILAESNQIPLLEATLTFTQQQGTTIPLLHQIYSHTLLLIKDKNVQSYSFLKSILLNKPKVLQEQEQKIILTYLLNYAVGCVRQGKTIYLKEIFNLNKVGVEHRLLIENGNISFTRFNNIVDAACKLKEFDWVHDFIKDWSIYLNQDIREGTVKIAKAIIKFENEEYESVIKALKDENYSIIDHALRAKWLLLCSYYEVFGNSSIVLNYARAFEVYLKRSRINSTELAIGSANLIKFVKKLAYGKTSKDTLYHEVSTTEFIFFKSWLIRKIKNRS